MHHGVWMREEQSKLISKRLTQNQKMRGKTETPPQWNQVLISPLHNKLEKLQPRKVTSNSQSVTVHQTERRHYLPVSFASPQ